MLESRLKFFRFGLLIFLIPGCVPGILAGVLDHHFPHVPGILAGVLAHHLPHSLKLHDRYSRLSLSLLLTISWFVGLLVQCLLFNNNSPCQWLSLSLLSWSWSLSLLSLRCRCHCHCHCQY